VHIQLHFAACNRIHSSWGCSLAHIISVATQSHWAILGQDWYVPCRPTWPRLAQQCYLVAWSTTDLPTLARSWLSMLMPYNDRLRARSQHWPKLQASIANFGPQRKRSGTTEYVRSLVVRNTQLCIQHQNYVTLKAYCLNKSFLICFRNKIIDSKTSHGTGDWHTLSINQFNGGPVKRLKREHVPVLSNIVINGPTSPAIYTHVADVANTIARPGFVIAHYSLLSTTLRPVL